MWPVLLCLGSGILLGGFFKMSDLQRKINGKLQFAGVMLLLFSMGISIGMNDTIMLHMLKISGQAFLFALLCTLFSVVLVYGASASKMRRDSRK